jgi:cytochrome c oxidase subunit 3
MNYILDEQNFGKDKTEYTGVHPQKFALWLAMASMTMFFAALTSALIVKKGDFKAWESFKIPSIFLYSTFAVILVSVLMQTALHFYRKAKFTAFRYTLTAASLMAFVFIGLQLGGWMIMKANGLSITSTVSASFIYLISSAHGVHLIIGLIATLLFLIGAIRSRKDPIYELRDIINPKRQLNLELLVGYWHYVDAVWVYLYIFFLLNYQ